MKILVVDDEALVRKSLRRAFEASGHTVEEAVDGVQGLELWKTGQPDLVFLDVLMPKMTGPQVLKEIGEGKQGKVILMTAYSGENNEEMARQLRADLFMPKPFEDIFMVVRKAEELVGAQKG